MSKWTDDDFKTYTKLEWDLVREIKALIDDNLSNERVLWRSYRLAVAALSMYDVYANIDGADGLMMNLQSYAYERWEIAKDKTHDDGWAKEYGTPLDEFIAYGEKRFTE